MILRNIAIRHGRPALSAPLHRTSLRSLSTEIDRLSASIDNHQKETHSIESQLNRLSANDSFIASTSASADPTVRTNFALRKHIRQRTHKLGSDLTSSYSPKRLVDTPPKPRDVTLELLLASQTHMGHATQLWNPANQRYIYGVRDGIHIISLEATAAHLRRAAKVVEGVAYHGGLILFVGNRPGQDQTVVKAAQLSGGCHLFQRWIPGAITNAGRILAAGKVKAVDALDQEVVGAGAKFEEELQEMVARPDLVVCLNPLENYVCLHECGLANIPTIGIIDTDANPTWVTYPIPANDDSLRSVELICGVLGRAGQAGQKRRLEAAKQGKVTWQNKMKIVEIYRESQRIEEMEKEKAQRLGSTSKGKEETLDL